MTLEELLAEMQTYGVCDLASEAGRLLASLDAGPRAGEQARMVVRDTLWSPGHPGQGVVEVDGAAWKHCDYQEQIDMTEDVAGLLRLPEPQWEKRQCVTKTMAAGVLWHELGRRPSLSEVDARAQALREEQLRLALDAQAQMGEAEEFVTPIEHELRVHVHDIVNAHHERDFRSLAVFPLESLAAAKVVVIRSDYRGQMLVETITGPRWGPGGWLVWALIWQGHMTLLCPPEGLDTAAWVAAEEISDTPALGFGFFWHCRHDQAVCAPGRIACRLCKTSRKAGDALGGLLHRHSHLATAAAVAGSLPAERDVPVQRVLRPGGEHGLVFRELFAGMATLTQAWRRAGYALEPVELYDQPHAQQGYRPDHDLSLPHVQEAHLERARSGPENVVLSLHLLL